MYPNDVSSVAFFWATILARGLQLSLGGHISRLGGAQTVNWGAWFRNDPRGAWPIWMFLLKIYCIGFTV